MKKLLIATTNPGKIIELSKLLSDLPIQLVSLKEVGIKEDMEETGKNYRTNSRAKAIFFSKLAGLPAISDDGGLEISALGGAPGVHSRRWLGEKSTDADLINHMKKIAQELPDNNRNAFFRTVISFAMPDGRFWSAKGDVRGIIARKPFTKILIGYPYRCFFFLPEINKYYHESELSVEEQTLYNHRFIAIQKIKPVIAKQLKLKI